MILAHYYQIPEIQDVADFVGDSWPWQNRCVGFSGLIVLCGVRFMGETAKILSRNKRCLYLRQMQVSYGRHGIAKDLERYKASNPERTIVSYVNTTAQVKTLTDICVTSSNALSIIKQLDESKFLFLPDRNLGAYIQEQLPKKISNYGRDFV